MVIDAASRRLPHARVKPSVWQELGEYSCTDATVLRHIGTLGLDNYPYNVTCL
jgi:hypothetical protein